ncbi:MAG: extracellular solute-binding protein [bacterium]|nr:extracellular solute-binding protein [bacterium]
MDGVHWSRVAERHVALRILVVCFLAALLALPPIGLAQQPETVTWMTTTALPTINEESAKKFMVQNPGIRINWRPTPSGRIRDVALSVIVGNPDDLDVVAIMYGDLSSFVKAGFLTNIEGLAWSGQLKRDLTASARSNSSYKGVLHGVPYFHAVHIFPYNMRLLRQAGFSKPPTTWDEVSNIAMTMKEKKMFTAPIVWPWNVTSSSDSIHWSWELITASMGGTLWDKALRPQFLEKTSPGYRALQLMVQGLQSGIFDRTSFELDAGKISELLGRGDVPMGFQVSFHDLIRFNSSGASKEAGNFAIAPAPDKGINMARTDIFAVTSRARARGGRHWEAVDAFMRWLAAPENLVRPYGGFNARGLSFKAFETDKEILDSWSKWVDLSQAKATMAKLKTYADIVPQYMEPFFPELRDAMNQELQKALLGRQTVEQTLQAIARRADELGKK